MGKPLLRAASPSPPLPCASREGQKCPYLRRTARTSRHVGVAFASAALVFGAAGNALACSIKDFSAVAECDGDKGVIRVTDVDPWASRPTSPSSWRTTAPTCGRSAAGRSRATAEGVTVTFEEDWEPNAEYRVHVTAGELRRRRHQAEPDRPRRGLQDGGGHPAGRLEDPGEARGPDDATTGRRRPRPGRPPTPSASEGSPARGSNDNNAPSPAAGLQPRRDRCQTPTPA